MGARQKLNRSYIQGGLLIAALVGGIAGSWSVFFVALAIFIALSFYTNEIRPN